MNEENTKKLTEAFPNLYKPRPGYGDPTTLYEFGFECGNGWFQLIWELSEKLETEIVKHNLLVTTDKVLDEGDYEISSPMAQQVKEKFGTLRFYMTSYLDSFDKYISDAEEKSAITCEDCGAPGEIRKGGWITVRCDKCELTRKMKLQVSVNQQS